MSLDFSEAVVVITGASSGIGRATALEFARQGASVVVTARRMEALRSLASECSALGAQALPIAGDVRSQEDMDEVAYAAFERFGRIDVWVNNAGVAAFGMFEDLPEDVFQSVVETDLFGVVHGARAALPYLREQGRGVIINNASVYARLGAPYLTPYVSAKFGVYGFSESLRQELDDSGIAVCTLMPPAIDTPFFEHAANYTGCEVAPVPPVYSPEKVARTIVKLARDPEAQKYVGNAARMMGGFSKLFPFVYDAPMAVLAGEGHVRERQTPTTSGNVLHPVETGTTTRGGWKRRFRRRRIGNVARVGLLAAIPVALGMWGMRALNNG